MLRKAEWRKEGTKKGRDQRCHPQSMLDLRILTKYNSNFIIKYIVWICNTFFFKLPLVRTKLCISMVNSLKIMCGVFRVENKGQNGPHRRGEEENQG